MPAINIQITTVAGQGQVAKLLKVIEPRTILTAIGGRLLSYVDRQFRTRGEGKWAPLSPLTIAFRRKGSDMPLQDSGHYKQSFVNEHGGPGFDYSTDNQTFVEVGSNVKVKSGLSLGKIHEFGTGPYTIRVKRAKVLAPWLHYVKEVNHPGIPARPVMPTQHVAEQMVKETVEEMFKIAVKE